MKNIRIEFIMLLFLGLLIFNESIIDLNWVNWNFEKGKISYASLLYSIILIVRSAFLTFNKLKKDE